ncbi:MAG: HEAT repeat domain-containing protein [Leucobacter sp.]
MGETSEARAQLDQTGLATAFLAVDPSARLQAALTAGSTPHPDHVAVLIAQCRTEPDFYVRDMLTWALIRHSAAITLPRLLEELHADIAQARSQALHTLSKIGDVRAWPAITDELLTDPDDEVARAAWRAAAGIVPAADAEDLARRLTGQLARGDREVRLSLSRAFVVIGEAADPVLREVVAETDTNAEVRLQAAAILMLIADPELGYDAALYESAR